jgi:hypothetical protein
MNAPNSLDLALEPLDAIDAPMTTQEGIGAAMIAFGVGGLIGIGIGLAIT